MLAVAAVVVLCATIVAVAVAVAVTAAAAAVCCPAGNLLQHLIQKLVQRSLLRWLCCAAFKHHAAPFAQRGDHPLHFGQPLECCQQCISQCFFTSPLLQ